MITISGINVVTYNFSSFNISWGVGDDDYAPDASYGVFIWTG